MFLFLRFPRRWAQVNYGYLPVDSLVSGARGMLETTNDATGRTSAELKRMSVSTPPFTTSLGERGG